MAASHVTIIAGHLYGVTTVPTYTNAINHGKRVWATEFYINSETPDSCTYVAKQILDCLHNGMSAYCWWWLNGTSACDLINTDNSIRKMGYVIAQYAKFVRPGCHRVDATYQPLGAAVGVYAIAFTGAQNVVVAVNRTASAQNLTFLYKNVTVTSVVKFTSSGAKNLSNDGTITATHNSFTTSLDAQSVTTFVSSGATAVLTPGSGRYVAANPRVVDAVTNFVYRINGQRLRDARHERAAKVLRPACMSCPVAPCSILGLECLFMVPISEGTD